MKKYLFTLTVLVTSLFSQNGTIVYDSFYSPSLDRTIPLAIYLPPGHSTSAEPYRTYIFLHGGGGSSYTSHIGTIKSTLDNLINDPNLDIEQMVAICAGVTWPGLGGGVSWYNMHAYSDSYLTGNYESVISNDLVNWADSCQYNLSSSRYKRAIGGFSMGVHCVQIALRNPDRFCAFTSHCGYTSIKAFIIEVPLLLATYGPSPPYSFDPGHDFYSTFWFAYSAAWSPDTLTPNQPTWQVDFPIDSETGELIPDIFDSIWVKNNHPTSIMQINNISHDTVHIYFDTRIADGNKPYNDSFHVELNSLNINHVYNVFPTGGHQYSVDQAESGFMFLDSIMDNYLTNIEPEKDLIANQIKLSQNYPNPFNPITTIEFSIPKSEYVELRIFDVAGREIQTLVSEHKTAGVYKHNWNAADNVASGLYFCVLKAGEFNDVKKLILLK